MRISNPRVGQVRFGRKFDVLWCLWVCTASAVILLDAATLIVALPTFVAPLDPTPLLCCEHQRVLIDRSFRSCVVNLGEFAVQLGELVVGADHFLDTAIFDLPTIE